MRLGSYPCELKDGTLASRLYGGEKVIPERHIPEPSAKLFPIAVVTEPRILNRPLNKDNIPRKKS